MESNSKTCESSMDYKAEYTKLLVEYIKLRKTELIYKDVIENLGILINTKD